MKQLASLGTWLGTSLVGSALVLGCSHAHYETETCATCGTTNTAMKAPAYRTGTVVISSVPSQTPTVIVPRERMPASLPPAAPVVTVPQKEPVQVPEVTEKPLEQTGYHLTTAREDSVRRRSFADITANPCFAHAADYSWLTGELQFLHARNCWRLRYASVDEEDVYGGGVTLVDTGSMAEFTSGQLVRVEGQVVNPDSHEPNLAYRVNSIKVIKQP